MKRKVFLLLVACLLITSFGFAQSGNFGSALHWELSEGTLTISGTGEMPPYLNVEGSGSAFGPAPWFEYSDQIEHIVIEDGVTTIGHGAFMNCGRIVSVTIPGSVKTIALLAFGFCTSLASVPIPEGVEWIESLAFFGCTSLTSIVIPASVTRFDGSAVFLNCYNLASVEVDSKNPAYLSEEGVLFNKDKTELILYPAKKPDASYTVPASVKSAGPSYYEGAANASAFSYWWSVTESALTSIEVEEGSTAFSAEDGILFNIDKTTLLKYPMNKAGDYTISDDVKSITHSAFANCTKLTGITIGSGVTSIANAAFMNCTALTSVVIPDNVTTLGQEIFFGCTNLTSITLPEKITDIEAKAFADCTELTEITSLAPDAPAVNADNAFDNVDKESCTLIVPAGSKSSYEKAFGWQDFSNIKEGAISVEPGALATAVSVYPNPVTDNFYVGGIDKNTLITLSDVSGRIVLQRIVAPNEAVPAANLPQGVYLLKAAGKVVKVVKSEP